MNEENTDTTEIKRAEIMEFGERTTGIVKEGKKQFYYYPDEPIVFQGDEVDYFHFKKPTLKKAKAFNVVLGNDMPARAIESLLRASLLRIVKKEGGEFLSHQYKDILDSVEMDDITEMLNAASNFFVKAAE
jgi:hypothetical protein